VSYFAVIREAGPAWAIGGILDQPELDDHGAFMNALPAEAFVLLGGPLAGSERGRVRVLLIVDADGEAEIHDRLADDPWARSDRLRIVGVEQWKILAGAERLSPANNV
jgi:hypothetical protein